MPLVSTALASRGTTPPPGENSTRARSAATGSGRAPRPRGENEQPSKLFIMMKHGSPPRGRALHAEKEAEGRGKGLPLGEELAAWGLPEEGLCRLPPSRAVSSQEKSRLSPV